MFGQFFTKLNIPIAIGDPMDKFKNNIQYITLFGFILGALEGLVVYGLSFLLPAWLCWMTYWILDGLLTGGFHLDALADTADGLFSSRTTDKIFAIMKDSRLGTMGSLALLYYYALVIGMGITLTKVYPMWKLALLAATLTMLTKTGLTLLFYQMKYVGSPHGLSLIWIGVATWRIIVAQIISVIIICVGFSLAGLIGYLVVLLGSIFYKHKIKGLLGGFSGDTLGAFACLAPLLFIITLVISVRLGIPG